MVGPWGMKPAGGAAGHSTSPGPTGAQEQKGPLQKPHFEQHRSDKVLICCCAQSLAGAAGKNVAWAQKLR